MVNDFPSFAEISAFQSGLAGMAGELALAKWRKQNAVRAVNDALVELRVANRLLREVEGLPTGDALTSPGVASDPAGAPVPVPAGSAGRPFTRLELSVFPPEWAR
jgi:hypothetical protein